MQVVVADPDADWSRWPVWERELQARVEREGRAHKAARERERALRRWDELAAWRREAEVVWLRERVRRLEDLLGVARRLWELEREHAAGLEAQLAEGGQA